MACALGGAALGATGLAGPPTSHLTAALLMIGKLNEMISNENEKKKKTKREIGPAVVTATITTESINLTRL